MQINKTEEGYTIRYYTEKGEYTLIKTKELSPNLKKKLKL